MFEVEKGIPIPIGAAKTSNDLYKWDRLQIGDSIFIGEEHVPEGKDLTFLRQRVYNAARKFGADKGREFQALVVEEKRQSDVFLEGENVGKQTHTVKGVRCWRLEDKAPKAPIAGLCE